MAYLVAVLILSDRWETRSLFGESFGPLDTLFSGLAFAGLIYTIALQRKELQLQREELRLTREELARTASAQEKSEASLKQEYKTMLFTARLPAMTSIIELRKIREGILGARSGRHLEQLSTFITELEPSSRSPAKNSRNGKVAQMLMISMRDRKAIWQRNPSRAPHGKRHDHR
jgi:hypothetical protein